MAVGSISEIVCSILIRCNTNLESIASNALENSIEGLVNQQLIAHVDSSAILNSHNSDVWNVEHEISIVKQSRIKERFELVDLLRTAVLENLGDVDIQIMNYLSAVTRSLQEIVGDLLVKGEEIIDGVHDGGTS